MSTVFCCTSIAPYRARSLDNERKFTDFLAWAKPNPTTSPLSTDTTEPPPYAIQLVRQVNYGPLESKRYFAPAATGFSEISEQDMIAANFKKLNACVSSTGGVMLEDYAVTVRSWRRFKNFKCAAHNKFFEVNLYEKDPVNRHHWRADVARPAGEIDL